MDRLSPLSDRHDPSETARARTHQARVLRRFWARVRTRSKGLHCWPGEARLAFALARAPRGVLLAQAGNLTASRRAASGAAAACEHQASQAEQEVIGLVTVPGASPRDSLLQLGGHSKQGEPVAQRWPRQGNLTSAQRWPMQRADLRAAQMNRRRRWLQASNRKWPQMPIALRCVPRACHAHREHTS